MPKDYTRIACMVGATLRGEFRKSGQEPLPEPLVELLRKLDEQCAGNSDGAAPVSTVKRAPKRLRQRTKA
jgi:hypothetical protein